MNWSLYYPLIHMWNVDHHISEKTDVLQKITSLKG
jgi:hypothetical protein